jgi:purine-cytosine permease-like protein
MVIFIIFMAMYGQLAPLADPKSPPQHTGATQSGSILTLLAIIYGSSASWSSIVSDYYVHYPVNTSKVSL